MPPVRRRPSNICGIGVRGAEHGERTTECDILIEGEKVEQVKEFVYFRSLFTNDSKDDRDIERRVIVGNKPNRVLFAIMNSKSVLRQARLAINN
ncbi:hypothetical protein EVAR_93423_1 [Eumeta japonica]|uniref:Uncharacterized protein n=1 Tax=Eumeta variegata TaxID=151549 RepID=A0A4C1UR71_EUMVA|nr:hypothetical protein EVAR_93423_1 [Eumeta japonica]